MSGLTVGITLGPKVTLTANFWNRVKSTGVAHVVVASGTNVTFVGVLTCLGKYMPLWGRNIELAFRLIQMTITRRD